MQRVSTLRQPTLGHVVSYHAERFAVQDDLVFTMLASGIPVEKRLSSMVILRIVWFKTLLDPLLTLLKLPDTLLALDLHRLQIHV